jgi:hypothetical protein
MSIRKPGPGTKVYASLEEFLGPNRHSGMVSQWSHWNDPVWRFADPSRSDDH